MNAEITLQLIGKPGCHLCDDAKSAVDRVLFGFRAAHSEIKLTLEEVSIVDDAELAKEYAEQIPVLLINNRVHNYWRIDETRLRNALDELAD